MAVVTCTSIEQNRKFCGVRGHHGNAEWDGAVKDYYHSWSWYIFFSTFPIEFEASMILDDDFTLHMRFWYVFFFALCVTGYTGAIVLKDKDLSDIVGLLQVGTFFLSYVLYVHYFLSVFFVYSYLLCILLRSFWPKLLLFSRQVVDFNVLEFRQFGLEVSTSFKIFVFYVDIILDQ